MAGSARNPSAFSFSGTNPSLKMGKDGSATRKGTRTPFTLNYSSKSQKRRDESTDKENETQ